MKRAFRHIRSLLALVLLIVAGVWLAVPRDICLTKALVESGCSCMAADAFADGCPCCASSKAARSLPCSGHSEGEAPADESGHSSNCLLVSSELSKTNASERVQPDAPTLDVVAVLPVGTVLPILAATYTVYAPARNLALNHSSSYRDNCVYLI